ncbi:MAG TPA: gliding motility-associated C-terminal domain-containing protein, partial [Chitinophagaceae bacterium]|nr:gliding motility-associated C-terminal domain-containing protein [Chitinophagaceae bacterium]
VFDGRLLTQSGTYYDTLVNAVGCDSLVILHLLVGSTTYGVSNIAICQGQSYLFNGVYLSTAGTYLDTLVNASGCDSILTMNLTIKPVPVASFTLDDNQICNFDSVLLTYNGSLNPANSYTYNFDGASVLSGTGAGPYSLTWLNAGIKTITLVVTLNGCQSTPFSQTVDVIYTPAVQAIYDSSICIDGTAQIFAQSGAANPIYMWNLNGANLVSGNTSTAGPLTLSWGSTGTKYVYIQCDNLGCMSNVDTAIIEVHELPTANIVSLDNKLVYCETDEVHLATDFIANSSYAWTPLELFTHYDYNKATLVIYDTTLVSTRVMTSFGCIATDTLTLYTEPCTDYFIPNCFTPNGDGRNDLFHVVGLKTDAHVEMLIYNRWGNLVYQNDVINASWNGEYKGEPAESDVYFYYIRITFPTGISVLEKGDLTLLR